MTEGVYKRWLVDTDFESASNWNVGRPPCGKDRVIIPDDSPVIYMQMNTSLQELTLPRTGELILGNDIQLVFTEEAPSDPACYEANGDVEFSAVTPAKWVDPGNWCATISELADCQPPALLETERVPCISDDVVFLRHRSYYVDLSQDLQIKVKTMKITGTAFTTDTFALFVNSTDGRKMFSPTSSGTPTSVSIMRQTCNDVSGCACENDRGEIQKQICAIQVKQCTRAACKSPVLPLGACCEMCGVVINATRGRGFNFDKLKDMLGSFFDNKTDVTTAISVTSQGNLQIVLQDDSGEASAQLAALITADIDRDLKTGGHKYALDSYTTSGSTASTSAHTGGEAGALKAGPIAGIAIGVIILVVIVLLVVVVFRRGRPQFKLPSAPNLPSLSNLSHYLPNRGFVPRKMREPPSGSDTPPSTLGPLDPGFANPLYDTAPFDDGNAREMELRSPMDEQPTFDVSGRGGFNNPLYGTTGAPFFTDPTEVHQTTVEVESHVEKL